MDKGKEHAEDIVEKKEPTKRKRASKIPSSEGKSIDKGKEHAEEENVDEKKVIKRKRTAKRSSEEHKKPAVSTEEQFLRSEWRSFFKDYNALMFERKRPKTIKELNKIAIKEVNDFIEIWREKMARGKVYFFKEILTNPSCISEHKIGALAKINNYVKSNEGFLLSSGIIRRNKNGFIDVT